MEQLIRNFLDRIKKENNLIEAVCLSNKDGIIFKEQLTPRNYRNIYSHSKSFTSLMVGIAIDEKMILRNAFRHHGDISHRPVFKKDASRRYVGAFNRHFLTKQRTLWVFIYSVGISDGAVSANALDRAEQEYQNGEIIRSHIKKDAAVFAKSKAFFISRVMALVMI